MKKLLFLLCLLVSSITDAQVRYTSVIVTDRFGDNVSYKEVSSIVNVRDSNLIVETKGYSPVIYTVVPDTYVEVGNKDEMIEITPGSYGYFCCFIVRKGNSMYQVEFREFSKYRYSFEKRSSVLVIFKLDDLGNVTQEKIGYSINY